MIELASESQGCSIISSSSNDMSHPASKIIEKGTNFWVSSGLFPQEIIIQLGESSTINNVDIVSTGIKRIQLGKCEGPQANSWEDISDNDADEADGELQRLSLKVPQKTTASYLRLKV